MGYRTIVALCNDRSSAWNYDPDLGRKIMAISAAREDRNGDALRIGLSLVECEHADTQSLIIADGYEAKAYAHTNWYQGDTGEARDLRLLKELADRLGYRVTKKPSNAKRVKLKRPGAKYDAVTPPIIDHTGSYTDSYCGGRQNY